MKTLTFKNIHRQHRIISIRLLLVVIILFSHAGNLFSQNIAINSTGSSADASAMLDITSTTSGLLIPRMTSVQRTAVASPATGLLVYDTTLGLFYYYDGTSWTPLFSSSSGWATTGNSGTTNGTHFIGTTDAQSLDVRTSNVIRARFTTKGQIEILNTGRSVFIGELAGANDDLSTNDNVFVGYNSGYANTTGSYNVAVGHGSLDENTSGSYNTALGRIALSSNTTASYNTAVGFNALYANTTGTRNVAMGSGALDATTSANDLVAIGYDALGGSNTGSANIALGSYAMDANTSGAANTAMGYSNLGSNTTGSSNVAIGYLTMSSNTSGNYNVAIGRAALNANTTTSNNVAIGYESLNDVTTAGNVAIGHLSLDVATSGAYNTGIGYNIMGSTTTGGYNVAIGASAFENNSTGSRNTVMGTLALDAANGDDNVIMGYQAAGSATATSYNVLLGSGAGFSNLTGTSNIFIGYQAAYNETGSNKLYIENSNSASPLVYGDFSTDILAVNGSLGVGTTAPATKLQVGVSGDGTVATANAWNTFSDRRLKTDFVILSNALEKIAQINGYYYKWKDKPDTTTQVGVIAQEIEAVLPQLVHTDEKGFKSVDYPKLSALLIQAVKEQQVMIEQLQSENERNDKRLKKIELLLNLQNLVQN